MPAARFYSSTAGAMQLSAGITNVDGTMTVDTTVGLPASTPFTLVLEPGVASAEEIVSVTAVAGTTLTITRGQDGSTAVAHSAGASVRHMATARDFREPMEHVGASTAVHGLAGAVVGTSDAQTLTNKSMSGGSNTFSAIPSSAVTGLDAHTAATAAHGATGAVVGTTNVQTLTGKTLTSPTISSPTISGTVTATPLTTSGEVAVGGLLRNNISNAGARFNNVDTADGYGSFIGGIVTTKPALVVNAPAAHASDILRLNVNSVTKASFDQDGDLTCAALAATNGAFSGTLTKGGVAVVTEDDSGWLTLTLGTGWTATAGHTPQYRKFRGMVYVRGAVTNSASTGTTIGTLPAGYRPSAQQFIGAHVTSDGKGFELMVDTAGVIQTVVGYATGTAGTTAVFPISHSFLL